MNTDIPAAVAGTWRLGDDLPVRRVGYGSMKLTGWPSGSRPDRDTALAVLRRAVELGVNHIDTCHYYSRDGVAANELIHAALHPYPEDLVIVTKVGPIMEGEEDLEPGHRIGLRPDNLRRAVEYNLRALGVDRMDGVNLRMDPLVTEAEGSFEQALETLAQLRDEKLIRHIGVSNVSLEQYERARDITAVACVQNRYSLAYRRHDDILDACERDGVAFVPYFPVSRFEPEVAERVERLATAKQATVPQLALAWLLARSPVILLIPGTGSVSHVEENIAAARLRLSAEELRRLSPAAETP